MSNPLPGPMVTFWTKAPEDAPEVKGYTCYFKPERLEWRVCIVRQEGESSVVADVVAHGPAIGVPHRVGAMHWDVVGTDEGDTRPLWLFLPGDRLSSVARTIDELTKETP